MGTVGVVQQGTRMMVRRRSLWYIIGLHSAVQLEEILVHEISRIDIE